MRTDEATFKGMGIDERDWVRRAREPIVDDADSNKVAARVRIEVWRRSGREDGVAGVPRRVSSWCEKVKRAGLRFSLARCGGLITSPAVMEGLTIATPPHCGTIQLVARLSLTTSGDCVAAGTYKTKLMVGPLPMLGLNGHSAALIKELRSSSLSVHCCEPSSYSGCGDVGEKEAYSWTWVSIEKLLIDENASSNGTMYS